MVQAPGQSQLAPPTLMVRSFVPVASVCNPPVELRRLVSALCIFQRRTPERGSLTIDAPQNCGGPSRRSPSTGRVGEKGALQLSSQDIQAMLEEEMVIVVRELADKPSPSLLALSDARQEMDDMAMRAQVCLEKRRCLPSYSCCSLGIAQARRRG